MRGIVHTLLSITLFFLTLQTHHVLAVSLGVTGTSGRTIFVDWSLSSKDPRDFYLLPVPWPGTEQEMKNRQFTRDEIDAQFGRNGDSGARFEQKRVVNANGRSSGSSDVSSPTEGLVLLVAARGMNKNAELLSQQWVTLGGSTPPPPPPPSPPAQATTPNQPSLPPPSTAPSPTETSNPDSPNSVNPSPTSTASTESGLNNGSSLNSDAAQSRTSPQFSHNTIQPAGAGGQSSNILLPTGGDLANPTSSPSNPDASPPDSDQTPGQNLSRGNNHLGLIIGLSVGIPLALILCIIGVFYIPRRRRMERRRRHLEQSAAFASNSLPLPYSFRYGIESSGERDSAQSVFRKHFKKGDGGKQSTFGSLGFNPARMVTRAWSVSSRGTAKSTAPSLDTDSEYQDDGKPTNTEKEDPNNPHFYGMH